MNNELLTVLEYLQQERGLERETVIQAVESAILSASRKSVSPAKDVRIEIDRKTCDIRAFAKMRVVDRVFAPDDEITVEKARRYKPDTSIGESIEIEVTPKNFGRIAAQTAKQAILQKIRMAEKDRIADEYNDRVGDILHGSVKRFDRNDVIIELPRAEARLPSRERVPTEEYQIGEPLRAYLLDIRTQGNTPEIILSRSHPDFVKRLFELEVSEIADGTVEIKSIAREAGYRSKIAVISHDEKVDPVGACVGMRGIRVKNIVRELSGEKIDIVRWHPDIKTFVANALAPAKLMNVLVDDVTQSVNVVVDPDQLSLAIGKKGQNARLTAKLSGWKIDIQKEEQKMDFEERVAMAISRLGGIEGIGPERAELLVHAGFLTIEGIIAADISDLSEVEGLDESSAMEVRAAAEVVYGRSQGEIR